MWKRSNSLGGADSSFKARPLGKAPESSASPLARSWARPARLCPQEQAAFQTDVQIIDRHRWTAKVYQACRKEKRTLSWGHFCPSGLCPPSIFPPPSCAVGHGGASNLPGGLLHVLWKMLVVGRAKGRGGRCAEEQALPASKWANPLQVPAGLEPKGLTLKKPPRQISTWLHSRLVTW